MLFLAEVRVLNFDRFEYLCLQNLLSTVGFKTFTMSESFKEMVSASSAAKLVFALIDPQLEEDELTPATQYVRIRMLDISTKCSSDFGWRSEGRFPIVLLSISAKQESAQRRLVQYRSRFVVFYVE